MADGTQFAFTPEVEAATHTLWNKVQKHVTPMEWRLKAPLITEINRLKREKNAVILSSGYTGEILGPAERAPWPLLRKPYSADALAQIIDQVLELPTQPA